MVQSSVSAKGQVTLPIEFRKKLGIGAPGRVVLETRDDAIVIRKAGNFLDYQGFLGKSKPSSREYEGMTKAVAARHLASSRLRQTGRDH